MSIDVNTDSLRHLSQRGLSTPRRLTVTAVLMIVATASGSATPRATEQKCHEPQTRLAVCLAGSNARVPDHLSGRPQVTLCWNPTPLRGPLSLTEVILPCRPTLSNGLMLRQLPAEDAVLTEPPLFVGLSLLSPAPTSDDARRQPTSPRAGDISEVSLDSGFPEPEFGLEPPVPRVPAPWVFKGNGGKGVKTWLSPTHVLEINPRWLNFAVFDSMDLCMTDRPGGPGQSGSQEWRSTFTVGLSTDWQLTDAMTFHAGYRFYNDPMPHDIRSGAFPNASQHVIAAGMSLHEGRHSLALIYGLDLMEASLSSGISSARQGEHIDPLGHLVSLTYGFTF